jgi:hypothetical protein
MARRPYSSRSHLASPGSVWYPRAEGHAAAGSAVVVVSVSPRGAWISFRPMNSESVARCHVNEFIANHRRAGEI